MKTLLTFLLLTFLFAACSSPLDKPYNEQNLEQDIAEIQASKDATDREIEYIKMYQVYLNLSKQEKKPGITYKEVIELGRELQTKYDANKAEEKRIEDLQEKWKSPG